MARHTFTLTDEQEAALAYEIERLNAGINAENARIQKRNAEAEARNTANEDPNAVRIPLENEEPLETVSGYLGKALFSSVDSLVSKVQEEKLSLRVQKLRELPPEKVAEIDAILDKVTELGPIEGVT